MNNPTYYDLPEASLDFYPSLSRDLAKLPFVSLHRKDSTVYLLEDHSRILLKTRSFYDVETYLAVAAACIDRNGALLADFLDVQDFCGGLDPEEDLEDIERHTAVVAKAVRRWLK